MAPKLLNPSSLEKPVGSGANQYSAGFCDADEYLDYVDDCRRYWRANQPKDLSAAEWIKMYPELKSTIKRNLRKKEDEIGALTIKKDVLSQKELTETQGLARDVVLEMTLLPKIKKLEKQVRYLRLGLETEKKDNGLTESQIQQARDFPLEDLIDTKRINKMWCCPFHEENTPSLHIYPNNQYHCFGCGAHGDSIKFVMERNKLNFVDAIKFLTGDR